MPQMIGSIPMAENADNAAELFESYRKTGDNAIRNTIVMKYMHIVRYAVISSRNIYTKFAEAEDVTNEAVIALMNAIDSFDPEKNVKFETYASIKVKGAIIDYIRKLDIVPRGIRKFAKQYDATYSELYSALDREPTPAEMADKMGISVQKLESCCAQSAAAQTVSFEEMLISGFDIPDENGSGEAERKLMIEERRSCLAEAIRNLKEKERTVITLYYYEKLKYSEISEVMEVSESRVCQIHSKAVESLRKALGDYLAD